MAAPKSSRSTERSPAGATSQLATILSAFLAERLMPTMVPAVVTALVPGMVTGSRLCVALSGGRDSLVLLHALSGLMSSADLPVILSAVHVHHGISPNADAWAVFCAEFCQRCAVPLDIVRVEVPRDSGEGLEAAARRMRHSVFAGCAADLLALAHHRDDQAETVLLNMLRGAGIAGAAGMLAERPQAQGPALIRPLLDVPRALIEAYAAEQALRWIEDESNDDVHYRRNYLRLEVMPQLEEKFPGAQQALARAAGHFTEGTLLLDELATIDRAALATAAGRIGLAGFNALAPARARNLLRFAWLAAGFRAPDARWIDEAMRQLATAGALSETCLSTSDGELHVYRGELHIVGHDPETPVEPRLWAGELELPWAGGRILLLPITGSGIRRDLLVAGKVCICSRQGGERLQPDARRPRRSLRNLLQEAGVPPWERVRLPLLWCGERLAWVGGIGVDAGFACTPGEAGLVPVWEPGDLPASYR
ncbi:MAG: tRNA lysidine(34) synthetase TilS [Propionivibrio sp.]|uniref:tRNA(Ile)-lysidine synthase n=1 Tax=Candidatus Propionivibrio dominans TaxID=2954373 RepID=A0A9D7I8R0_9RHOO|nr:tRNA lysidine(34) synthetase TilS [Candidatus Propionivibrio dominans]